MGVLGCRLAAVGMHSTRAVCCALGGMYRVNVKLKLKLLQNMLNQGKLTCSQTQLFFKDSLLVAM
jgi:hypothetical protein